MDNLLNGQFGRVEHSDKSSRKTESKEAISTDKNRRKPDLVEWQSSIEKDRDLTNLDQAKIIDQGWIDQPGYVLERIEEARKLSLVVRKSIEKMELLYMEGVKDVSQEIKILEKNLGEMWGKLDFLSGEESVTCRQKWSDLKEAMEVKLLKIKQRLETVRAEKTKSCEYHISFPRKFDELRNKYSIYWQRHGIGRGSQWLATGEFFSEEDLTMCEVYGEQRAQEIMTLARTKAIMDNLLKEKKPDVRILLTEPDLMMGLLRKHGLSENLSNGEIIEIGRELYIKELEEELLTLSKINWMECRNRTLGDRSENVVLDPHVKDVMVNLSIYRENLQSVREYFAERADKMILTLGWEVPKPSWRKWWENRWQTVENRKIESFWTGIIEMSKILGMKEVLQDELLLTGGGELKGDMVKISMSGLLQSYEAMLNNFELSYKRQLSAAECEECQLNRKKMIDLWGKIEEMKKGKGGVLLIDHWQGALE